MSSWLKHIFGGGPAPVKEDAPVKENWRVGFARQDAYEAEGARSALEGRAQECNPYNKDTDSEAWNFWLYGHGNAAHEQQVIAKNEITYSTTADEPTTFTYKAEDEYRSGQWKPKYATVPSSWSSTKKST